MLLALLILIGEGRLCISGNGKGHGGSNSWAMAQRKSTTAQHLLESSVSALHSACNTQNVEVHGMHHKVMHAMYTTRHISNILL